MSKFRTYKFKKRPGIICNSCGDERTAFDFWNDRPYCEYCMEHRNDMVSPETIKCSNVDSGVM